MQMAYLFPYAQIDIWFAVRLRGGLCAAILHVVRKSGSSRFHSLQPKSRKRSLQEPAAPIGRIKHPNWL